MTGYINRWTIAGAWAVLMGIVWALFVPRGVSITTFTLLGLTGAVFVVVASALWSAHEPTPSLGQTCVTLEADEGAARARRPRWCRSPGRRRCSGKPPRQSSDWTAARGVTRPRSLA
jgi:hypothetical protein